MLVRVVIAALLYPLPEAVLITLLSQTNKANLTKDLALAKETLSEIVGGLHNAKEQARLWDERQLQLTAEKQRVRWYNFV